MSASDPLWLQILEVVLGLLGLGVLVYFLNRFLGKSEDEEPLPLLYANGEKVTPEELEEGLLVVREWGEVLSFWRKAEADEYREGVDEWLFKPVDTKNPLIIGLIREDFDTVRRVEARSAEAIREELREQAEEN